ncbi:MAG TPA: OmpA family protein [Saprospiraceae bacterium]|nr:OmpA family protein [Saprospiraceae bacterium]HPI06176.1 OmpA family protein [Saprospiraceae bacterium]
MRICFLFALVSLFQNGSFAQDFRVQIAAFEQPMAMSYFTERGVNDYVETTDQIGLFRYFAGAYATRLDAEKVRQEMIAKGFPFASIIDVEEQRILCEVNCPYFRNGVFFIADPQANIRNIYFDFGLNTLTAAARTELDRVAERLIKNKALKLNVLGYTDGVGSPQANVELAAGRARAARNYLIAKGIRADRMFIKVFGEADPVAPNGEETSNGAIIDLPENRKWNRRVVLALFE